MTRHKITLKGFLLLVDDFADAMAHTSKSEMFRKFHKRMESPSKPWEDFFPSSIKEVTGKLLRNGEVEKIETKEGTVIKLTEKGRRKILHYRLEKLEPKKGKWDGLWRMVFFDVEETERKKRNLLRDSLKALGLKQMQESVWVSPFDVFDEVKYIREVVGVPHSVKLGLLKEIENSDELKKWFEIG